MSHLNPGLISGYNSLTDKHLSEYFSNARIRRHLQRVGLITRSGRIVPDKEYRHKLMQRAHQRHVRECLAQAVFHKVLEMERVHQIEIKRKLEEFTRRERVHKIKVERSKRYEEHIINILSPRPPTGPRGVRTQRSVPEREHSESTESPGSSRPNTAPGKMQRPVRLKPLHSNSTTASHRLRSPFRQHGSFKDTEQPFNCTNGKQAGSRLTTTEFSRDISPYCLPVINNFVTPVPPTSKRKDRGSKVTPSGTLRGRRLRPTTATNGPDITEEWPMLRTSMHQSRVCVTMVFLGKTVHLSHDLVDMRDEVKVFQQHCGGENLCVYKGRLREGETFRFLSRRHRGFPFSLTFFLNGLQVERLSSCCEFKHRKGSRLGGRHRHFGFTGVEGASPCYRCIIAMGLDKRPTPPPKRVKDGTETEVTISSPRDTRKDAAKNEEEGGSGKEATLKADPGTTQDMETEIREDIIHEEKPRDDYEEDFEADDEGPAEDSKEKDTKSLSPSSDKELQEKERSSSESEDDDGHEDRRSHSESSSSGSDRQSEDEDRKDDQPAEQRDAEDEASDANREETAVMHGEKDEPTEEGTTDAEIRAASPPDTTVCTVAKDSETACVPGESTGETELEVSEASIFSANDGKENEEDSLGRLAEEAESLVDECKPVQTAERAKSVQEKLAEAILKGGQCNSEPEFSDTTTEEEEEIVKVNQQNNKDALPVETETSEMQQETIIQETTCETGGDNAVEVAEELGEVTSEQREVEEEKDNIKKEVEKPASEEHNEEELIKKDNSEVNESKDTPLAQQSDEEVAENQETEPPTDEPAETDGAAAAENSQGKDAEEGGEKSPVQSDMQPSQAEQEAEQGKEDESSTLAPMDNVVVQTVTVSETVEMKAEPSAEPSDVGCEDTSVTAREKPEDGEATGEVISETKVPVENSSSSSEGRGSTGHQAEQTADISGTKIDDEKSASHEDDGNSEGKNKSFRDSQVEGAGEEEHSMSILGNGVEKEVKCGEDNVEDRKTEESHVKRDEVEEKGENKETGEEEEGRNTTEETEDQDNAEAKENKEITAVTDEEKPREAEKPEKDIERIKTEVGECSQNKGDENGSEENVANIENKLDGRESDQATEEQAEKNGEQEPERISDNIESKHDGDRREADAANDPEGKAKEAIENMLGSEGGQVEREKESENGKVDAENGEAEQEASAETKQENVEGKEGQLGKHDEGGEKTDHKNSEEQNEGKDPPTEEIHGDQGSTMDEAPKESKMEEGTKIDINHESQQEKDALEVMGNSESQDHLDKSNAEDKNANQPDDKNKSHDDNHTYTDHENREQENEDRHSQMNSTNEQGQNNVRDVILVSPQQQTQYAEPTKVDVDSSTDKVSDEKVESITQTVPNTGKRPDTDHHLSDVDPNVVNVEKGAGTEEGSKPSEEGESVVLKTQAESSQPKLHHAANDISEPRKDDSSLQATNKTEQNTVTPEDLENGDDGRDLVTDWVALHQASKFFQKFVEPLDDLKELPLGDTARPSVKTEIETSETGQLRSASPHEGGEGIDVGKTDKEIESILDDSNNSERNTKLELALSDLRSNPSEGHTSQPAKEQEVKEKTEVTTMATTSETDKGTNESTQSPAEEEISSEKHEDFAESLKGERDPEDTTNRDIECSGTSKMEVESIAGTRYSGTSVQRESIAKNQQEKEEAKDKQEVDGSQTTVEEIKDRPSLNADDRPEPPQSPGGLFKTTPAGLEERRRVNTLEIIHRKEEENTEGTAATSLTAVTDLTTFSSTSDDGSEGSSQNKRIQSNPSDRGSSTNGDNTIQLIEEGKPTLSKDQLTTYPVGGTSVFGQSSYPLFTATHTESGH